MQGQGGGGTPSQLGVPAGLAQFRGGGSEAWREALSCGDTHPWAPRQGAPENQGGGRHLGRSPRAPQTRTGEEMAHEEKTPGGWPALDSLKAVPHHITGLGQSTVPSSPPQERVGSVQAGGCSRCFYFTVWPREAGEAGRI